MSYSSFDNKNKTEVNTGRPSLLNTMKQKISQIMSIPDIIFESTSPNRNKSPKKDDQFSKNEEEVYESFSLRLYNDNNEYKTENYYSNTHLIRKSYDNLATVGT